MYLKAKYIVVDYDTPFIFPELITHSEFASKVSRIDRVTSAGFVYVADNGSYSCYGDSVSLRKKSDPEKDNRLLNKFLGGVQSDTDELEAAQKVVAEHQRQVDLDSPN